MKKIMILAAFIFFLIPNAFADTITMKSGKEIEGKIMERTHKFVKVEFSGVQLTYFLDEIEKINGEKVSPEVKNTPAPAPVTAVTAVVPVPEETSVSSVQVTNVGSTGTNEIVVRNEKVTAVQTPKAVKMGGGSRITRESSQKLSFSLDSKKAAKNFAIAGVMMLVIFFFLLIFYVYASICLQFIAVKTGQGPVWMAWVPIANLFLMCKVGRVPYVYLFIILGVFIPIIGFLVGLGFSAFIWYKIALARNKPGWVGAICCLPFVNLVVMGYLAFSN